MVTDVEDLHVVRSDGLEINIPHQVPVDLDLLIEELESLRTLTVVRRPDPESPPAA